MSTSVTNVLEVRGLSKTFGAQRALKDFGIEVRAGEIHALLGENGSGKSTLVKCLSGYHEPDPGAEITVGGRALPVPYGPNHATEYGLAFVHQDLGLIPTLPVLANFSFGRRPPTGFAWKLKERQEARAARETLTSLGRPDIDPRTLVQDLSVGDRTVVALARCLHNSERAEVMVLDEPTAALAADDVEQLFRAVHRAADAGLGIVYISHRLDEIFDHADRITILRDGFNVGTLRTTDVNQNELIALIVGRTLDAFYPDVQPTVRDDVVLRTESLSGPRVRSVSLSLHRGEVLGVAGLRGSGKSELGRLLFGAQRRTGGEVYLEGDRLELKHATEAIARGIAMVPANRHRDGAHLSLSLTENITLLDFSDYAQLGTSKAGTRRGITQTLLERFDVRPRDPSALMSALSGGNQQKAVLAKWMHRNPKVLILDEPAQGIDIGAKTAVYKLLEGAAREGMAVLVISEEFEDLARLCDRVLVIQDGRVIAELTGDQKTREQITELVYQHHEERAA